MHKIYSIIALMYLLIPALATADTSQGSAQDIQLVAQQGTAKTSPQFAVSIPDIYYEHPVHLLHPYIDYWVAKGPLLEKVVTKTAATKNTPLTLCNKVQSADAILVLQPHLFYNPQSRVFYAEIVASAYTQLGNSLFTTKQEAQQIGDLAITPDFYIKKAFSKALAKVMLAVNNDQNLTANLKNKPLANAPVICKSLNGMSGSKIYY